MGLISRFMNLVFGSGGSTLEKVAGSFWENPEAKAAREAMIRASTLNAYASEFQRPSKHWFDALMDGINRLPRPMLALGTLGLFASAMTDPLWFASRMQGLALVPEPLWWLMGAIVRFYFGARHQVKSQELQRSLSESLARTPQVITHLDAIEDLRNAGTGDDATLTLNSLASGPNAALDAWRALKAR